MSLRGFINCEFIYCPDCGLHVGPGRAAFVAHREQEHPPAPKVITGAGGIQSQEKVGQPGGGS